MDILRGLLHPKDRVFETSETAKEELINLLDQYQSCLDIIKHLQKHLDSEDIEIDKDIHMVGTLSGRNSIDNLCLQIVIDKHTREMVDARFMDSRE